MLLIKNAEIHTPASQGRCDVLLGGGRILRMEPGIRISRAYCEVVDARNLMAVPGFIDGHVHMMGGGGEGGYSTRTPELQFRDAVQGGVTTMVGCLGTDGVTRSLAGLLAKARGLEEEGITTYILTGHYQIPVQPLTSSIEEDLLLIDKIIGVGEVAISDHRSTQPTLEEFLKMAAQARRGGILSGKAGIVNLHLGDGARGLSLLRQALDDSELPPTQFLPTHVNRNPSLFEEGVAYAKAGGFVDFTTSTASAFLEDGEVPCGEALRRMVDAGVDSTHITFTSDGQGSLPDFDARGQLRGISIGRVTSLFAAVREAVLKEKVPLEIALGVITSNPARILKLPQKGRLAPGLDADVVLVDPRDLTIHSVIAKGRMLMKARKVLVQGVFH